MPNLMQVPHLQGEQLELPLVPDVSALITAVDARLAAIDEHALPSARERRQLVQMVWQSESDEAVPLFVGAGHVITALPAGADRLGDTLADEQSWIRHRCALVSLASALQIFSGGGRFAIDELEPDALPPELRPGGAPPTRPTSATSPEGKRFTTALRAYLAQLRAERLNISPGSAERRTLVDQEYQGVARVLQEHLGRAPAPKGARRRPARVKIGRALKRSA